MEKGNQELRTNNQEPTTTHPTSLHAQPASQCKDLDTLAEAQNGSVLKKPLGRNFPGNPPQHHEVVQRPERATRAQVDDNFFVLKMLQPRLLQTASVTHYNFKSTCLALHAN